MLIVVSVEKCEVCLVLRLLLVREETLKVLVQVVTKLCDNFLRVSLRKTVFQRHLRTRTLGILLLGIHNKNNTSRRILKQKLHKFL